jgi:hypothetical protein
VSCDSRITGPPGRHTPGTDGTVPVAGLPTYLPDAGWLLFATARCPIGLGLDTTLIDGLGDTGIGTPLKL